METETSNVVDFTLPSLGSDMDEGTVLTWLVDVGDHVVKGDVLLRVDTEKAEIDVEVWHEAVVVELVVGPGDTVPVGSVIARLAAGPATNVDTSAAPTEVASAAPKVRSEPADFAEVPQPVAVGAALRTATPMRTVPDAIRATPRLVYWPAVESPEPKPKPDRKSPGNSDGGSRAERRQAAVAALMERSNREVPHFHLVRQLDLTDALQWLDEHNESVSPRERILPAAVLLYAVANAAAGSVINGTFDGVPVDGPQVDLGVAVHIRGGGLVTPVMPAAETLTLDSLMSWLQAMVGRARANRLNSRDMTPATLTVTNLGDSGVDRVLGVIRPPERALVGFGRISENAVAIDGALEIRRTADVTLSADHRVVNGHAGARFLDDLASILSKPNDFTVGEGSL